MNVHFTHRKRKNPDGSYTFQLRRVVDRVETATVIFRMHLNTKRLRKRAESRLRKAIADARNDWAYNPTGEKSLYLHDAAELYIDWAHGKDAKRPPMCYRQAVDHQRIVREFVASIGKKTPLNQVKRGMFNRYFDSMVERYKKGTVVQYAGYLQTFFTYAYNAEWMNRNMDCFTREQHRSLRVLKKEQFISDESLAKAFCLEDFGLICRTLAETGLRVGELQQLTCASFSTVDLTIRVESVHEERTKRHARVVPISEALAMELSGHSDGRMHYDALFSLSQTTLRDKLKPFGLSPHSFRKFFNTALMASGAPDEIRRKVMGHTISGRDQAYFINWDPDQAVQYTNKVHEKIEAITNTKGNDDE